jgi:hypothetical protein
MRSELPGTYQVADGSAVAFDDALNAWAAAARPALLAVAESYNRVITYRELAEDIQSAAGIRTRMLLTNWIGRVLGRVARDCQRRGEHLITALCVRQDGTVGPGYAEAAQWLDGVRPADPELHAAKERLKCYRTYAKDLPTDGGEVRLTPQEAARRRNPRYRVSDYSRPLAATPRPRPTPELCPRCFTELPLSGVCNYCD